MGLHGNEGIPHVDLVKAVKSLWPSICEAADASLSDHWWRCVRCGLDVCTDGGKPERCEEEKGGCGRARGDLACQLASTDEHHPPGECADCDNGSTKFVLVAIGPSPGRLVGAVAEIAARHGLDMQHLYECVEAYRVGLHPFLPEDLEPANGRDANGSNGSGKRTIGRVR